MRKAIFSLLTLTIFIFLILASIFYWKNLRGALPGFLPSSKDITTLIPEKPLPAENLTDFPLTLPEGFSISIFAKDLGGPRVLLNDSKGNLLVSIPSSGKVVALPDNNNDGVADEIVTVIDGLNRPHGLALKCYLTDASLPDFCKLFIAEANQVAVYDYDRKTFSVTNKKKTIDLPTGGNHFTRTLLLFYTPDGEKLLTSIGSSCNVCFEDDQRRTKILISNLDGSDLKVFASGLRNAVFMTGHPLLRKVWVTEMGRDLLGDNLPPDEINIIEEGKDYGWPICYGKNIHDTNFDKQNNSNPCTTKTSSYIDIPAHSAPLGLAFFPEGGWPQDYQNNLLVAYHGSWNRTSPTGYKIVRYKLDRQGNYLGEEDFISGWITENREVLGRPVDILFNSSGEMFISDDKAGVIYRVVYQGYSSSEPGSRCIKTGCSGQICSDQQVVSTCEFREEYACYKNAVCERQADGNCGWTQTPELLQCLRDKRSTQPDTPQ